MAYEAKVIEDSICDGSRLTTLQLTGWVATHAEFNTHCSLGKNASSARAVPGSKYIEKVQNDPFIPVFWGKNRPGMSPVEEIQQIEEATAIWLQARNNAIDSANRLVALNLTKQLANRLLAPFAWITVAATGDEAGWSNFFALRCHPDAQQEFQHLAYMAQKAYFEHTPSVLKQDDWHLPYVNKEEKSTYTLEELIKISVGRTARTSYLTQEGKRDVSKDIELHDRLLGNVPIHASPADQVCQATPGIKKGKYYGWTEYRKSLPNEFITKFTPNYKKYFGEE